LTEHQNDPSAHNEVNLTIESMEHFNSIMNDGFEVQSIRFYGNPQRLNVSVVLARDQERILANANNIDDYVLRLRELCDFQKKKPCFVYIPDANLYHEFEEDFIELIHPSSPMSIVTKQLNSRLKPEPDFTRTLKFSKELS
jgi:hypothetical protein